jgi:DNA mismatch repair ATPase MutS
LTLTAGALILAGWHWGFSLGLLTVQMILNRRTRARVNRVSLLTSRTARVFRAYARILRQIEDARLTGARLREMQDGLFEDQRPVSRHILSLARIASGFEVRRSEILHPLLNALLLWDLHCVARLERWKSRHAETAAGWLEILGEFEAISSFANLRFNHEDWAFPGIVPEPGVFQAEALGHPLIPPEERVCNDLRIGGGGTILIVTGPNMAGKSTFLKTVGVNLVLGLAGAPVCASFCRVSPFKLYTSMQVSDSLDKRLSLFYAELQRLKKILDVIARGEPVFYLLDEMLKGTNALDRQAGAIALLRQLVGSEAAGVVATHDLELTKLETEFPGRIRNLHFDGTVEGDRLVFDYTLKPGRCESFNALALMRRIGIKI